MSKRVNRVERHEIDPFGNEMEQTSWQKKASEMIGLHLRSGLSCLRSAHGSMYRNKSATSGWSRDNAFISRSRASRLFSAARAMSVSHIPYP